MTSLIIPVTTAGGLRLFELLVHFEERLGVAETCFEFYADGHREMRDTRDVLLLVGRKPRGAA